MRQIAGWQVMVHEPIHDFSGERIAFAVVAVTLRVRVHQRGRVNQQLKRRLMFAAACAQTNGCGQIAASAVAADGNPFGIHMQTVCMGSQPLKGRLCIVVSRRKHMLGREAVVHGKHGATAGHTQLAAQYIVRINVANHPAAAVVVHQCRQQSVGCNALGAEFADFDLGPVQSHQVIVAVRHRRRVGLGKAFAHQIGLAGFDG